MPFENIIRVLASKLAANRSLIRSELLSLAKSVKANYLNYTILVSITVVTERNALLSWAVNGRDLFFDTHTPTQQTLRTQLMFNTRESKYLTIALRNRAGCRLILSPAKRSLAEVAKIRRYSARLSVR